MSLESNKQNAIAFYLTGFNGNPQKAIEKYVGEQYVEHNPDAIDGKQGFIDYFERMHADYPNKSIEFVRCIAEGDLVALHTHQTWYEGEAINEYITMDFFRFDDSGKIVEHWDSIQKIPERTANGNLMY